MNGVSVLSVAATFAVVAATLALPAARLGWHALGEDQIVARALPPPLPPGRTAPPDTNALLALAPFGDATPAATPQAAPQDALDLVLQGVLIGTDPARSAAFILVDGTGDRFRIGDIVTDGITLTAIAADFVRLDVSGQERVLRFPNAVSPDPVDGDVAEAEMEPMDKLSAAIVPGVLRDPTKSAPPETIQDYIDLWRTRIRANPQQVLDTIGLVPGERGYTIAPDHDSGIPRIGLRTGDLVTRVNGQAVGDVDRDRDLYDQIAASGLAQVEIERDGEVMIMSFPLR